MRFNIKNQETTSFKKRYNIGFKKPVLVFGDFSFTVTKSYNLEYIYIYNFKKSLKKYHNFKTTTQKIWLFLHKNYPLTKKSKNARMGKGKGAIARYCSRILQNHNVFEFVGFSLKNLLFLKKIFKKKVNLTIKINSNFFLNQNYKVGVVVEKHFFFKKYLI